MTPRRIIGILLLLVSPILLFFAARLISERAQNPQLISEAFNGAEIRFSVERTNTTFNGDCIPLTWEVTGETVREVYIADAPVTGTGERQHCDGTTPRIRLVFADDSSQEWTVPVQSVFNEPSSAVRAWLLIAPSIVAAVAGVILSGVHRWQMLQRPIVQYVLALVFAVVWVFVLDLFTNSLNVYRYVWDHYHYIDMAENGISGNAGLVAPYAYRPIPPLLAGFISNFAGRSVVAGFRVVTYVGLINQLVLVFALARQFTRQQWVAWMVMVVIGLSTYHVKFLLFDIYRPDSLAYSLILVGMLAFIRRNITTHAVESKKKEEVFYDLIILAVAVFGMLVREFCAIPAALLAFRLLRDFRQTRRVWLLIEAVIVVGVVAAAYWLPRQIIQVGRSDLLLDVDEGGFFGIVTNLTHNSNIILGVLIYLLPLIALLTPQRAGRLWARLDGLRVDLGLYALIVVALTMIGGTDIARFVVYLFVPLIITLTIVLDEGVHWLEMVYMLAATAIYNRIIAPVPQENLEAYLDFYIVWDNRISGTTLLRGVELAAWFAGMWALRWGLLSRKEGISNVD